MCRWRGAWRHFPLLVSHLPHILLGGTIQGVDLHSDLFEEPLPQKKTAASGAIKTSRERGWERREQRFADVAYALVSLIDWLKLESIDVANLLSSIKQTRKLRVTICNQFVRLFTTRDQELIQ